MKFKIPFTRSSLDKLKKRSVFYSKFVHHSPHSTFQDQLDHADTGLRREEYLGICLRSFVLVFVFVFALASTVFVLMNIARGFLFAFGIAFLFSFFIYMNQKMYPKLYNSRRQKAIERNLIPALQDMLVQLNSGIPLFSILVNISSSDYGELSEEFKKAVKDINAGKPQAGVLEELGERNPSLFFRRTLWQLSNGMKAGSDISIVIKDSVRSLNEEQLLQIQNYGNKLNPMIMFYMLVSVIVPALSVTFLTVISSMISLPEMVAKLLFISLLVFVTLIQITFLGIIKSLRPSLL